MEINNDFLQGLIAGLILATILVGLILKLTNPT